MHRLPAQTLSLEGPDALDFAHAQLASPVRALQTGTWQWSAWLSPQGRVRALLQVARLEDRHLLLLLRGGTAARVADELQRYVLRSRVRVAALEARALDDAPASPEYQAISDGTGGLTLGLGDHGMHISTRPGTTDGTQQWRDKAIRRGQPWLPDPALDTLTAPALSLQRLGAVSLDKGCYPGQEIVARLHYRGGGGKRHLAQVEGTRKIVSGSPLFMDGKPAGIVLDSMAIDAGSWHAQAVLRDSSSPPGAFADAEGHSMKFHKIKYL